MIEASGGFCLACLAEGGHTLQVSDHPGGMIDIVTATVAAFIKRPFVDVLTGVADGDFDIHTPIVTS